MVGQAQAVIYDGFGATNSTGDLNPYAFGNWTIESLCVDFCSSIDPFFDGLPANGDVSYNSVDDKITITGADYTQEFLDDDFFVPPTTLTLFTITAATAGLLSFNWDYFSDDPDPDDFFSFELNGAPVIPLADNWSPDWSGVEGLVDPFIDLAKDDVFGFSIFSDFSIYGAGIGNISNFQFIEENIGESIPLNPVPLPPALLLFGTALAGLRFVQKKKLV